jgi:cyanophycin synthetase
MEIVRIQVMRGPSLWSVKHPRLIVLTLDCRAMESLPEQEKMALWEDAGKLIPNSPGTSVEALTESLIIFLLDSAGMPCTHRRIETDSDGYRKIIFSYMVEPAGIFAAEAAVSMIRNKFENAQRQINEVIKELKTIARRYELGPTSAYILEEAVRRNIPFRRFQNSSLFTLGYGKRQKMIRTAVADTTSGLGIEMAGDKDETRQLLGDAHVPVPKGLLIYNEEELKESIHTIKFPIVTKPLDGNHGRGVTTRIYNLDQALFGFRIAKKISDWVIVEEFIEGEDYRFLLIDYKLTAVARRTPARVIGDGRSTISELIDKTNQDPDRGETSDHVLAPVKVDKITEKILSEKNLTLQSVLPGHTVLYLKETANISAGGTAEDVTDEVHPFTVFMAERIARLFKLDICGIDIMTTDIKAPLSRETGAVIEVNAGPGIRMHTNPQTGTPRNIASPIMKMLFPTDAACRIPVVAVTGTNGKTTTTRLIAYFAKQAGYTPGYTTSDGIYINDHLIKQGDCTGSISAKDVLFDPTVDFAVLECARGGILRSGLGFDSCDVSVITNVTEDHLGLEGINTLEDMLKVKAVVAHATKKNGFAVLNADDKLVYSLYNRLSCNIALFSNASENPELLKHIQNGGVAAFLEDGYLTIYDGKKILVEKIQLIPLTHNGKARHMIKNMLAASLAAYLCKIDVQKIRDGLRSFIASAELTPGRMNLFRFKQRELMIDYAHNVDGFREIKKYVDSLNVHKTGIIAVAGDRRDQDIETIGRLAGEMFDEIIIRHERDLRGRSAESVEELLLKGIRSVDQNINVNIIPAEEDAIRYALQHAPKNGFIFECADNVHSVIKFVKKLQEEELSLSPNAGSVH